MKESGVGQGVSVNGLLSGGITGTINFTAYISPYLVLNNGGYYTKHIYMGSQRIVSKLGSSDIFTIRNPLTDTTANKQNFVPKLTDLTGKIKVRYDSLGVVYKGTSQGNVGMITSTAGKIPTPLKYYFHSDHLGSSSLITDATGGIVQHLEYIPFGEVFIDERAATSTWSTPYKFNAKELDEETGLYYYGARYYDPRTSVWISKDPLAEKYPNVSSYVYCHNNPVNMVDPNGKEPREGNNVLKIDFNNNNITKIYDRNPKFHRYDSHLYRLAEDEIAANGLFAPDMDNKLLYCVDWVLSMIGIAQGDNAIHVTNKAYSWVEASQSSKGYQYVEFVKSKGKEYNVRRQIENLNEKLGVKEGFENVVTRKQTCEGKSNNVSIEEYWNYRTLDTANGKKKVEYQHITIDLTKPAGESVSKSNWQEAKPSKYNPNEKN